MSFGRPGLFITFEGGEGTGKSTHAARLAEHLAARGSSVVKTREPGGTPEGEALRALLVEGEPERWSALGEALLNNAARVQHLEKVIRPALQRGAVVISDRFMDSTRAYQGTVGGLSADLINALEAAVVGTTRPDLTLILDVPAEEGLARAGHRAGQEDRFERKGADFHGRLRTAFLAIAAAEPERCVVVDTRPAPAAVFERIVELVDERLAGHRDSR